MIEQKILAVKIKAKGVVEYLRRPQVRQYENNATVIWAWFEEVGLAESITAKLHYELPTGETLVAEQFFTAYTTTEDLINDIPNTEHYGEVVIPSGTKVYIYEIPQGLTSIDGELKYNISAYLTDGSIVMCQQDKIRIWKSTPPTGTFVPDTIDSTLEALLASKTDLTDFNALRDGSLGFTLIDLDSHSIDWSDLIGTAQLEMLNGVVQDIGLEVFKYGRASGSITDGTPAQFVKYQGQRPIFKTPVASEVNDNPHTVRVLATQSFTNNQDGYFTRFGNVRDINTLGYLLAGEDANDETTWGDTRLWFDPVTNGLTRTRPSSPNAKISMGYVTKFHNTQGIIDVDVVVYPKLSELQDVMNGATDGQVWVYDASLGLTKPSSRLTDLEEQVLSIGGVENSAIDKVNDLLLDYADNVKLQGASVDIVSDTTSINLASYTDINISSQGDTDIQALQGVSIGAGLGNVDISTGAGTITISADSDLNLNSNSAASLYANGDLSLGSDQTINLYGASGIDLYSDANIVLGGVEVQVNGTLQVNGDIVQNGAAYETHAEQVYTTQNQIILRDGAVAGLGAGEWVGIIGRIADGTHDAQILINGDGQVRIGDSGDTQAVATRQDSPTSNGVAYWNNTDKRFDTNSTVLINPALTSNVPLTINALSGQTNNLFEIKVNGVSQAYFLNNGILKSNGIYNLASANNSRIDLNNTGIVAYRDAADSNPALKVNLANASATGNIAEFQFGGTTLVNINRFGNIGASGIYNYTLSDNAFITTTANGTVITRNRGDANPALTVNEQQGTGDILRLQYGGSTLGRFDYRSYLGLGIAPTYMLDVLTSADTFSSRLIRKTTTTGGTSSSVVIGKKTTGDMTDGFGVALLFSIEDNSNIENYLANIGALRQGADNSGSLYFNTYNAGASNERMRIDKDGTILMGATTALGGAKLEVAGNVKLSNTEPELHLIDTNNDSDYYIANSNGTFQIYDSTNDSARVFISSAGKTTITDLQVNTDGTLLATSDANGAYTVSALSNYKFVEVRATLDGYRWCSSGKIPVGKFVYGGTPATSMGLSMIVTGKPSGVYGTPATFTLYPANSGLTSLTVDADMSNYDITFEIIGWTY